MTANVAIMPETHANILMVPNSAIIQKDGKYFVIVDKGDSQKETREVVIGLTDDKNVEVVSGLNLGEKVFSY
jgi:multidrug efflux pump subunit AcrA (membrane-fusion protein)